MKFSGNKPLWLAFVVGLALRLWGITNPLADFHEFRQTYTALFARHFYAHGMNILTPDVGIHNYSNISEFQVYPFLVACLYHVFGEHDVIGRLVAVAFSMATMWMLFLLVSRYFSKRAGYIAAMLFAILPTAVYYSRVFMLESMMLFLATSSIYTLTRWLDDRGRRYWILAVATGALALLIKIPSAYLVLPFAFLFFNRFRFGAFRRPEVYLTAAIVGAPAVYWYFLHARLFPDAGIVDQRVASLYLGDAAMAAYGQLLSQGKTWSTLFFTRIGELHLAISGMVFLVAALTIRFVSFVRESDRGASWKAGSDFFERGKERDLWGQSREQLVFVLWIVGVLAFVFAFIGPNLIHEYYQMPILPPSVALIAGYLDAVWSRYEKNAVRKNAILLGVHAVLFAAILPFCLIKVSARLQIDPLYYEYSLIAREHVPPGAEIIYVDPMPRTEVFYHMGRQGYMLNPNLLPLGGGHFLAPPGAEEDLRASIREFHDAGGRFLAIPYPQFSLYFPETRERLDSAAGNLVGSGQNGFLYDLDDVDPEALAE